MDAGECTGISCRRLDPEEECDLVVVGDPDVDEFAAVVEIAELTLLERPVTYSAVKGFDVAVLRCPAWRDVHRALGTVVL